MRLLFGRDSTHKSGHVIAGEIGGFPPTAASSAGARSVDTTTEEAKMNLRNPSTFRRQIGGAAMIVAPLVIVLAELLHGRFETSAAEQIAVVTDNTGRWYAAHILVLVGLVLTVPAFLGLARLLERSRPVIANVSRLAFVPGLVALTSLAGMELVLWQMAQPGRDRVEMVALLESLNESAGIAPLFGFVLLFPVAWLLAGIGLYFARATPVWGAALIALSQPVGFVSEFSGGPKWLAVAAQIAFAIGLVPVGVRVLRQSDDAWEQRPVVAEVSSAE